MTDDAATTLDAELLEILRCPLTRGRLRLSGADLVCDESGLTYPIRDGIPVLLIDEARLPAGVASLDDLRSVLRARGTAVYA